MTPLTQQLENKKKELKELHEEKTGIEDCYESNTRLNEDWDYSQILKRMEILKKEIAILEQAIAEIKSKDANSWYFICTKCNKESITDLRGKEKYLCYECALQKQRQEILDKMQEIVDSEKKRCDEANAYTCWHHLKKYLEQLNQPKTEK